MGRKKEGTQRVGLKEGAVRLKGIKEKKVYEAKEKDTKDLEIIWIVTE